MPPYRLSGSMSPNKKLVATYLAETDMRKREPLLAEDVEWVEWANGVPVEGAITRGRAAYLANYGDDALRCDVTRLTEEGNVVVAEGMAHVTNKEGQKFTVRFCDVFELAHGKIQRKSSFGALLKGAA